MLPARLQVAWLVPLLEFAVAAALLVPPARTAAAFGGAAFLAALRPRHGRESASAVGAISPAAAAARDERRPIAPGWWWRNFGFAGVLAALALPWQRRPLQAVDYLTVGAGVTVAALLYMSTDRLLARVLPRAAFWEASP